MRYCDHRFVTIKEVQIETEYNKLGIPQYAIVACPFCGQIRQIFLNGEIHISVESGNVLRSPDKNETDPNKHLADKPN